MIRPSIFRYAALQGWMNGDIFRIIVWMSNLNQTGNNHRVKHNGSPIIHQGCYARVVIRPGMKMGKMGLVEILWLIKKVNRTAETGGGFTPSLPHPH
jgi:hypothetical protein